MVSAAAYVLKVRLDRREIILSSARDRRFSKPRVAEPVPIFDHSRRAPLVVFCCFEDNAITHVAKGNIGASAGTGLVRLNMEDMQKLSRPILFDEISDRFPIRLRAHLIRIFQKGGKLPPKTLGALVDILISLDPAISERLSRFSATRSERIQKLKRNEAVNLAIQKETVAIALDIAGIPKDELLLWDPAEVPKPNFLAGLPSVYVREDVMIVSDFSSLPGFKAITDAAYYAVRHFVSEQNPSRQLTVIMANRLPLEKQTGADLIYYNEKYRSFVLVQYKAMEKRDRRAEFRWIAGDQLSDEIDRMDILLGELAKVPKDTNPDSYRFSENPFFLKFCSRVVFNPDDKGLFPGFYLPLDLWKTLDVSGRLKGPWEGTF